ncbi:MAG: hypothetical protein OXU74_06730 [Gemmatimonadota bacterium]|nr:hypothetical protein [Gemmatimonadota bacterium]
MAHRGVRVILTSRSEAKARATVEALLCGLPGAKVEGLVLDLTDPASAERFAGRASSP